MLSPGVLAGRLRRDQLPPLLRHQRPGRPEHGAQEVFEAAHRLVLRLLAEGKVDGLRIDHPDGLVRPRAVLPPAPAALRPGAGPPRSSRPDPVSPGRGLEGAWKGPLRECIAARMAEPGRPDCGWPLYVVAEKILGADEPLADDWPVHGTSGYDFLNRSTACSSTPTAQQPFTRLYQRPGPGRLAVRRAGLPQQAADPAGRRSPASCTC